MPSVLGRVKTRFHHAKDSIALKTKSGGKISLSDFCKSVTPPCHLNPLLFNGHLQTMWTAYKSVDPPVFYKRRLFESVEPRLKGSFAVDFVHRHERPQDATLPPRTSYFTDDELKNFASQDRRPMLITLHGLSGGSQEIYIRHVLSELMKEDGEWEACVLNARGCAESRITSEILFNARATWDLRQTISWLKETFPNRPLFGLGFSLGANILTNYLGEEGEDCGLKSAVLCSNPWNLDVCDVLLQSHFLGKQIYSKAMGMGVRELFEKNVEQISQNSDIDIEKVRNSTYLHEFDRLVQTHIWGYPTEGAYYRDASCSDAMLGIKVPVFAITAEDDPIARSQAVPYQELKQTPYVCLCSTPTGGHIGWFEWGGQRWFVKPILGYLRKMAEDVDLDAPLEVPNSIFSTEKQQRFDPVRRRMGYPLIRAKI